LTSEGFYYMELVYIIILQTGLNDLQYKDEEEEEEEQQQQQQQQQEHHHHQQQQQQR